MTLDEFIEAFAGEFEETPATEFTAATDFKSLDEWSSLTALSIIAMLDDAMDITVTGADLRSCTTIEELYNLVLTK